MKTVRSSLITAIIFIFIILAVSCWDKGKAKSDKWIPIFNGYNLDGWIPKVTGYKAGENPLEGFRAEEGMIRVDYSKFIRFNGRFGHLFYSQKLSSYKLRLQYRFTGEVLPDAPGYCKLNSGVMLHSQSPESMDISQNWPVSLETQLLGSTVSMKQTTANMCTPGTLVSIMGEPTDEHCIPSSSGNYYDNEWVTIEIVVLGGKAIHHIVNGDTVLTCTDPQTGGFLLPVTFPLPAGTFLNEGYIALQAEGQPIDFRNIELLILSERPCQVTDSLIKPDTSVRIVDDFESYPDNQTLSKVWYQPWHGGRMIRCLEPVVKGGGKYSLKCNYKTDTTQTGFYSPVCRVSKWNLSGCNAVQFWFKPDGSGREMTFEFNIADKEGKNIHDLWDYKYLTEKGDTMARIVVIPFSSFVHNTRFADSLDFSPVFKPESVIEAAIYIGGRNDEPGTGTYYFDEIAGRKLQF